jgi:hypothetical protein
MITIIDGFGHRIHGSTTYFRDDEVNYKSTMSHNYLFIPTQCWIITGHSNEIHLCDNNDQHQEDMVDLNNEIKKDGKRERKGEKH